MKTVTKLAMIAATVAAFASSAAFADDRSNTRFEWRWVHGQWMGLYVPANTTTIAVYADRQGVTQRGDRQGSHFEYRFDAHGNRYGLYVPDNQ